MLTQRVELGCVGEYINDGARDVIISTCTTSSGRGGWTRPRDVRNNCIPEHGALENVWGKRFFLVLSFTRAPRTEFGETLGRCSR